MATAEAIGTGISFALTDEQKALRELAHEFAAKEIRPVAADYDEHQTHPADVIAKAHEVGLMNPHIPEELGGAGLGSMDGALIGEELCWGCSGIGTSIVANILGALPMLLAGTDEQKREWLPPLLEEPILCSFALTEPGAGSDVSGDPDDGRAPTATSTSSTARRCSSPTRARRRGSIVFASTDKDGGPSRPDRVRRPDRRRRRDRREAPRQDGPARDRHLGARLPGRRRARGQPARRGGRGLQDRDADARPHAAGHRRRRGWRRARGLRARGRLRAASASSSASRSR